MLGEPRVAQQPRGAATHELDQTSRVRGAVFPLPRVWPPRLAQSVLAVLFAKRVEVVGVVHGLFFLG